MRCKAVVLAAILALAATLLSAAEAQPETPDWAASTSAYRKHSHGYHEPEGHSGGYYYNDRPPSRYAHYGRHDAYDGGRYGREGPYGHYYPRGYDDYEGPDHRSGDYYGHKPGYPDGPICDPSKGIAYSTGVGEYTSGYATPVPANLAPAKATCPADGFQIGGYCTVVCREKENGDNSTRAINKLGAETNWYSDDTRDASGQILNGLVSSFPGWFYGFPPRPPTEADDDLIAEQISFITYPDTGGDTGVMDLWATNSSSGKASVRFYQGWNGISATPIIDGTALADISVKFRWYLNAAPTPRIPAFNIRVIGTNLVSYTLVWLRGDGCCTASGQWYEFEVTPSTAGWRLYCNFGCPGGGGQPFTMNSLLASQFGSILSGGSVIAVGFNLGSDQRQCHIGIDWLETNLLNAGAKIDFGPGTPAVTTFPVVTMGAATIGGGNDPVFAPPSGWSLGPSTPVNPETEFGAQTRCWGPAITNAGSDDTECANVAIAKCCTP